MHEKDVYAREVLKKQLEEKGETSFAGFALTMRERFTSIRTTRLKFLYAEYCGWGEHEPAKRSLLTAREELAAVLAEHTAENEADLRGCRCGWKTSDWDALDLHVTDALLASPALARAIREREFEAIQAGNLRAIQHEIETPSRGHGECCSQTEESP